MYNSCNYIRIISLYLIARHIYIYIHYLYYKCLPFSLSLVLSLLLTPSYCETSNFVTVYHARVTHDRHIIVQAFRLILSTLVQHVIKA